MRTSESGNAIFYILVAVALLAALIFAVAEGGRSSMKSLASDRTKLLASEIIEYGEIMKTAVAQLRLRGTAVNELSFAHPDLSATYGTYDTDPGNEIFNPAGGAVIYKQTSADVGIAGAVDFMFLNGNEVEKVGTTCGADSCVDLVMAAPGLREEVCVMINDFVSVDNPSSSPPTENNADFTGLFDGTFSHLKTIGDNDFSLDRKSEGCFADTAASAFVYYKVLLAR